MRGIESPAFNKLRNAALQAVDADDIGPCPIVDANITLTKMTRKTRYILPDAD